MQLWKLLQFRIRSAQIIRHKLRYVIIYIGFYSWRLQLTLFQLIVKKLHGMVKELLSITPQMAFICNSNSSYPLHIAIRNQQSCKTMYELFNAFSNMVKIKDSKTSLLPFMLAAVGNWENEVDQISIIFRLLQEDPLLSMDRFLCSKFNSCSC